MDLYFSLMKSLRSLHLFLGCLFAPMLIFFAVTGSWQLFNWHESKKDRTYTAPPALAALSFIHKDAHIPGTPGRQPTPLRYFMLATAIGLVATTIIGIIMAYRFSCRPTRRHGWSARGNRPAGIAALGLSVACQGAHASRVWATASRRRELFMNRSMVRKVGGRKACFGETPKPTRETRALPRSMCCARSKIRARHCREAF